MVEANKSAALNMIQQNGSLKILLYAVENIDDTLKIKIDNKIIRFTLRYFEENYGLDASIITYNQIILYSPLLTPDIKKGRKMTTINDILKEFTACNCCVKATTCNSCPRPPQHGCSLGPPML